MPVMLKQRPLEDVLPTMSIAQSHIYLGLLARMQDDMTVSISLPDFAKLTNVTMVTIRKSVLTLEELGLVTILKRGRGPGAKLSLFVNPPYAVHCGILPEMESTHGTLVNLSLLLKSSRR